MLFEIKGLKFRYPQAESERYALQLEAFSLKEGERVFVRGRSGAGKSTLLNLLGGVLTAPPATLFYKGQDMAQMSPAERDRLRANDMGIIFQQFNLLPFLSARENVQLPFLFSTKKDSPEFHERANMLFDHLKLGKNLLDQPVRELSVGQQQRVAVVRALQAKPKLILADEPTSSLDTELRASFIELLLRESQEINAAVLFVSHDPALESHFTRTLQLKLPEGSEA